MIGVGGAAEAAAPAVSFARNGCGGSGGIPSTPSTIIDFIPLTFSPKAEAAISALLFAFTTACFRRSFLECFYN
jgi:hypothetical protein